MTLTRHAIGSGRALFTLPGGRFYNATKPLEGRILDMTTKVYAAEGAIIRKLPTETRTENGVKISIGFPVCTLTEWCDEQAEAVAEIMNRGEAFEANQARIAELEKALLPFSVGSVDVSGTAVILGANAREAKEAAIDALSPQP
jgi:hypothetical protein